MCQNLDASKTNFNNDNNILLVDRNRNYMYSNYTNLLDDDAYVDIFQMTPLYQIRYLGKEQRSYLTKNILIQHHKTLCVLEF
jgi:hypothetical protein